MPEVRANTNTLGDQSNAAIAALSGGGYVVVWQSQGQDDSANNFGIYAQRYDATGNPVGFETRINNNVAGDQTLPSVAALAGGGYVVTWTTPGMFPGETDVHMQRYNANGVALGIETQVNTDTSGPHDLSAVTGLAGGGYVVTWTSSAQDGSGAGVYAQRYDANGNTLGVETRVNTYTGNDQDNPAIAALSGGGYVVVWQSYNQDGSDYGVYSQLYNASGTKQGGEVHVSTATANIQANASVTGLSDGSYVVAWQSYGQDGSQEGIFFQHYSAAGALIGGETQANTTTASVQSMPSVAALADGGFAMSWQSFGQDGSSFGIVSRGYDANELPTGAETLVNTVTAEQQNSPVVAGLSGGGYALAYQSYNQDGSGYGIYLVHAGTVPFHWTGTEGADSFTASSNDDWTISGLGGADTLNGAGGNDTIDGGDGNDVINGGAGRDTIHGGDGDDLIRDTIGSGNNILDGGAGIDTLDLTGAAGSLNLSLAITGSQGAPGGFLTITGIENLIGAGFADLLTGDGNANVLTGAAGNDVLTGAGGNDTLLGGDGDDSITGGLGDDVMDGGAGNDLLNYFDAAAGVTISLKVTTAQNTGGAGTDTISGFENINGSAYNDTLTGDDVANLIIGGLGNDILYGFGGNDILNGGGGTDYLYDGDGNDTLNGGADNDVVEGRAGTNVLNGNEGDDIIQILGDGINTIDGGTGTDAIVVSGFLRTSGMNVDLTSVWTTGSGSVNGSTYTSIENVLGVVGSDYDDTINLGGAVTNADVNIISNAGAGNDTVTGTNGVNYMDGGEGNDTLRGLAGNDVLTGSGGDDVIDGGTGADSMTGGAGNDSYYVDGTGDTVTEAAGEGVDTVYSYATTYTLGANVENLAATSNGDNGDGNYTGNALANVITGLGWQPIIGLFANDTLNGLGGDDTLNGLSGDDVLNGGDGNDILHGGTAESWGGVTSAEHDVLNGGTGDDLLDGGDGDDLLVGGAGNDTIDGGAGIDTASYADATAAVTVRLGVTVAQNTLGAGIDTLTGIENLTGSAYADTLVGNSASNRFDGGAGADEMRGGKGDDFFTVDNAGDVVIELDGEGSDTVNASVSYSLAGQYVEVLNLTGTAAINGTGNSLNNRIVGNSAANILVGGDGSDRLDGGAGADTMKGGAGNDVYVVDQAGDVIVENNGEGTDTVEASFSYSIAGQYIEILKLMGTGNFNATGNGLANTLYGNSGANILNGGTGADDLYGGAGDDTYIVDNAGDRVFENNGEGTDTVQSSVTFSINGQYVENLTLTGTAAINGTGNSLANVLTGNGAANTLSGGGGNDALHGGLGSDTLTGGAGQDSYWFETTLGAGNVDTITDFNLADDTITLDRTIFSALAADGTLASAAFWQGTAAHDADDRIVYDKATGKIYYDADGSGAGAAVLFAQVTANTALTAADFLAVP